LRKIFNDSAHAAAFAYMLQRQPEVAGECTLKPDVTRGYGVAFYIGFGVCGQHQGFIIDIYLLCKVHSGSL
jgi:hypothetical protein